MAVEPELVILRVCEFFWPTTTDLNSMAEGTTEILAELGWANDLSPETEAHPEARTAARKAQGTNKAGLVCGRCDATARSKG